MYEISKLMENLILYGHSKIFIPSNEPNENYIMYFYLNTNSDLIVDEGIWKFNKPFWDGYNVDQTAHEINRCMTSSYASYKELVSFISTIIVTSIHNYGLYQEADPVYDLNDNDKTLSVVYNFIMAALDIPNSLLYKMLELPESDIVSEIIRHAFINYKSLPYSKDLAPKIIDNKMNDLLNRLYSIESIAKASIACLPLHTKTLLNRAIKQISVDETTQKVDINHYTKRRH